MEIIDEIAARIDAAAQRGDIEALRSLLHESAGMESKLPAAETALLYYFQANIHSALYRTSGRHQEWLWSDPHRETEIFSLRRAINHSGFTSLHAIRQLQILTNLANGLDHLGRTVEALEYYDRALALSPNFGMALGNRGLARYGFATSLFDQTEFSIGLLLAHEDLAAAVGGGMLWDNDPEDAKRVFLVRMKHIERGANVAKMRDSFNLDEGQLGTSKTERTYRDWSLTNRLFLNPINVFGGYRIAASDVMTLPAHAAQSGDPPMYIAWYNQMVREFVTARSLLFEATRLQSDHYSDHKVILVNTLDYPVFAMSAEKARLAFRSAYSLLDKIAGFLNSYLGIGLPAESVTARNIWTEQKRLRKYFEERPNLSLRGLYWLFRDILDDHGDVIRNAMEPEAVDLKLIRHALEHRCLVLREYDRSDSMGIVQTMTLREFDAKALKLLKLARAALIHLSLAVHEEERKQDKKGLVMPMQLPTYIPLWETAPYAE